MLGSFGTQLKAASMDVLAFVLGGIMCPDECVSLCSASQAKVVLAGKT